MHWRNSLARGSNNTQSVNFIYPASSRQLLISSRMSGLKYGDSAKYKGTLTLNEDKPSFTFTYSTSLPSDSNWIGIYYAYGGGPDNGEYVQGSLAWNWAPSSSGTVLVSPGTLNRGTYKAYLLANGGYEQLAEPIIINLGSSSDLKLFTETFTTHNARQGEQFTANIGNLVNRAGDANTRFSTADLDSWAKVDEQGIIRGTPPANATNTTVLVNLENSGATATLTVHIPVRKQGEPLVDGLRILSFNLWVGGQFVNSYHEKQIRFLSQENIDIVGIQESTGGHGIRLARALGWHSWQGPDVSIITRYPIVEVLAAPDRSGGVRIGLDGNRHEITFWNCHLGYDPYGPYDFCFYHMTHEQVMEREAQSGRTPQIIAITAAMKDSIASADDTPVFLTGDFNAPSHLDWVNATKDQHCGTGYTEWPTSKYTTDAGMLDSYRIAHPDPVSEPGITWSPIYLENGGRKEPLDRIDFIYHKGSKLMVQESRAIVTGKPTAQPNHADNEWTSDHKAVLTVYKIKY
ncbi:hypothetical protein NQ176_g474 [Zarea fungicola]|uniref:Uncharacterized protein n=1 Tax=Zarea fungicola TaxID=93591 RepID=A0ACC1NXD7_9HYPO|nr:hypothetical protein NQ176_g474 [Lecanicillium fungicola]